MHCASSALSACALLPRCADKQQQEHSELQHSAAHCVRRRTKCSSNSKCRRRDGSVLQCWLIAHRGNRGRLICLRSHCSHCEFSLSLRAALARTTTVLTAMRCLLFCSRLIRSLLVQFFSFLFSRQCLPLSLLVPSATAIRSAVASLHSSSALMSRSVSASSQ